MDKIKVKVSDFVAKILENDAIRFGFMKNGKSNKNALLNKLIPTLVEVRKARRSEIEEILQNEYNRSDSENIYSAVNTVIDRVYFNGEQLSDLEEYIWIRPSKESMTTFDEIETSEALITAQEVSVYIRGLLNEYSRLPQYKREMLAFDNELNVFSDACCDRNIVCFRDKMTGVRYKAFAFEFYYGYLLDQTNYCVIYDLEEKQITSLPVNRIKDIYLLKQKYKPSEKLMERLQDYGDRYRFCFGETEEVEEDVF